MRSFGYNTQLLVSILSMLGISQLAMVGLRGFIKHRLEGQRLKAASSLSGTGRIILITDSGSVVVVTQEELTEETITRGRDVSSGKGVSRRRRVLGLGRADDP
jgi:hypothetical protein